MTLQSEIEAHATSHRVGWYVVFDGIETRLGTHDPGDGETYITGMLFPRASGQTLDRRQGVVRPGGFSITQPDPTGSVNAFFARRGGTESPLAAGLDASSTTVQVNASDFSNGATVYVGRETITLGTYTSSPSPRYTGCTRGAHGSQATEHQTGSTISTKPRHWDGRRATLYEFNRDTNTAAAVRAGVVDGSPVWKDDSFDVDFLDLTTLLNRPIVTGWEEVDVVGMAFDSLTVDFKVDDASSFVVSNYGWAVVTVDDVRYFYKVESVDTVSTPNVVTCYDDAGVADHRVTPSMRFRSDATIKTIAVAQEDPALFALHLMCSRYGDSGDTYDVLPGVAVDDGDGLTPERRMGAGLPEAWVDVDSWLDAVGVAGSTPTFVLDESMHLLDFLFREVVWRMGGFIYQTSDGKLAFRQYDPATADSSLVTYDESDLASTDITVVDDEREVISGAVVESNWDFDRREYMHKSVINFVETQSVYGDNRDRLEVSSRSLRVGAASSHPHTSHPVQESDLQAQFLRAYARTRLGLQRVRLAFRWQYHLRFFIGHRFKLTLSKVPDGEGGAGISAKVFEVVHFEPEKDTGRVIVECEASVIAKLIGPRMEISAISSNTLTLNGDAALQPEPSTLKQFPAGCSVRIFDASASPPFSASEVEVVDGAQTTQGEIDLVALPSSFTIAVGDHVQMVFGSGNVGATNDIGADVEDHAIMTDTDGNVDGDTDHNHRWQ
jgi:hypothetical protein